MRTHTHTHTLSTVTLTLKLKASTNNSNSFLSVYLSLSLCLFSNKHKHTYTHTHTHKLAHGRESWFIHMKHQHVVLSREEEGRKRKGARGNLGAISSPVFRKGGGALGLFAAFKKTKLILLKVFYMLKCKLRLKNWWNEPLKSTTVEGHGVLPVIGGSRNRRWCRSRSSWFIDFGVQPIQGVVVRGGSGVGAMTPVPWKCRGALGGRGADMAVLYCAVGRGLRRRLRHWTHISVPEGLYSGIVGVRVVVFNIWIRHRHAAAAALLVSAPVLPQLRVPCLDPDRQMERQIRRL